MSNHQQIRQIISVTPFLLIMLSLSGVNFIRASETKTSGVLIEIDLGAQGTASELIGTPKADVPLRDPSWIYIFNSDGTINPNLLPTLTPLTAPTFTGVTPAFPDLSGFLSSWNVPRNYTIVGDNLATMRQVLFPSFTVLASAEWQDSGITVTAGQRFQLAANGQWSLDKAGGVPSEFCGPDGLSTSDPSSHDPPPAGHPAWPKADARGGALIGRIGTGQAFLVGSGGVFTADQSGSLQFVCNDLFDGGAPGGSCIYCTLPGMTHISNNTGNMQVNFSPLPD